MNRLDGQVSKLGCRRWLWVYLLDLSLIVAISTVVRAAESARPNVVIVLADDMGFGDPTCYNAESRIRTPHIDRLSREGVRFTDAHAPAAWCTPSRYGLLTGRYPWRSRRQLVGGVIEPEAPSSS